MLKEGLFNISTEKKNPAEEQSGNESLNLTVSNIDFANLEREGTKAAGKAQGDFTVFKMWVNKILAAHVQHATKHSNKAKNRIKKLEQEIEKLKASAKVKSDKKEELEKFEIPEINDKIKEKKLKIEEIKAGDAEGEPVDKFGYYLSLGILAGLTVYLVIFYTSVIYGAFIFSINEILDQGIASGDFVFPTIVNLNAIPNVYDKFGIIGPVFLLVSTTMFIALGYLIHKFQESKEYLKATFILLFTLIFDAILAYEIVEVIHQAKYSAGLVEIKWTFSLVFTQIPFYIIIFAGFAVYVIWGLVLNYIFEEREKMQPGVRAIKKIKAKIEILENELQEYKNKATEHSEQVSLLETKIKTKEMDKEKEIFDRKEVGHQIGNFVSGWIVFVNMSFEEPESSDKIDKVKQHVEVFMTKIEEKTITGGANL